MCFLYTLRQKVYENKKALQDQWFPPYPPVHLVVLLKHVSWNMSHIDSHGAASFF